jgi:hypothetical protein
VIATGDDFGKIKLSNSIMQFKLYLKLLNLFLKLYNKEIFQSKFRDKETIRLLDLKLNLEISITPMEAKAL